MNNYENELTYDLPIEYFVEGKHSKPLHIYPIRMDKYMLFQLCSNILIMNKNKQIGNAPMDKRIIKMSNLDYIFHLIMDSEEKQIREFYYYMFFNILNMSLHIDKIEYLTNENGNYSLKVNDELYDKDDFDEIKRIIIMQNIPDYNDAYIDPEVEKVLLEAEKFMNRHKKKMGSLEDQIICVIISTNFKMQDIEELTIRKFTKILQRVDYKLHYEIYKTASLSGMVSFEKEIDHWMTEIKQERFEGLIVESNQLEKKLEHVT